MLEFLDKLRAKPEYVRKRIALFTTLAVFFVIVNIWWVTRAPFETENAVSVKDVVSPLGVVANVFSSAKESIDSFSGKFLNLASGTDPVLMQKKTSAEDVVYPDQIFKDPPGGRSQTESQTATQTTSNTSRTEVSASSSTSTSN